MNHKEQNRPIAEEDINALDELKESYDAIFMELSKVIVGQEQTIHELLIAIFSKGHCILEGVPGLAKTLLISTLAKSLELEFNRIQFTPDLMPTDITGTEILQEDKATGQRVFKFLEGPIFANLVLADEINRTPPKTQAALLEAMQERQVTIGGKRSAMKSPFFVLATQNPIEQEGTYPLPEAQQDRFMFKVLVDYPEYWEEYNIAHMTTSVSDKKVNSVISGEEISKAQELIRRIPVAPHCITYALNLVRATRVLKEAEVNSYVKEWVSWGAGPRAVQNLILGAKATAALDGRHFVSIDDIKSVAHPVLRHRIIVNFAAESEGITSDTVIDKLLESVSESHSEENIPEELKRAFA